MTGAATQRRRLAVLALIGAAGDKGISRDKLVLHLWPDSDPESARHALTQALYGLRRDLQVPALLDGNTEIRLNPAVISSDVADFRTALESGDLERAAALYSGPFLDGFYASREPPEFERWVDGERSELAKAAERALEGLAAQATARGQHRRAADWWRRLVTLDPLSSRVAVAFMKALAAAGDRAAALRHARVHEELLHQELQLPPDPEVLALAEQLRATAASTAQRVTSDPPHAMFTLPGAPPNANVDAPSVREDPIQSVHAPPPDRYRVEREIGRGRLTTVYLAHDVKHGRPVALKALHQQVTTGVEVQRFIRELMLIARLRHPHILPLYDSGQAGSVLYYVTPYVEGGSLRARLAHGGPLAPEDALGIAREVAEALAYAHRHNTLHRDVTPEHILLDDGHALIGGFGIARAINNAFEARLTEPGLTLGTPAYMSPEQARATMPLDGRSDIYSAGCVLFEMLTGAPPAARPDTHELIPADLRELLGRALAREPADRFESAHDLARALAAMQMDGAGGR